MILHDFEYNLAAIGLPDGFLRFLLIKLIVLDPPDNLKIHLLLNDLPLDDGIGIEGTVILNNIIDLTDFHLGRRFLLLILPQFPLLLINFIQHDTNSEVHFPEDAFQ